MRSEEGLSEALSRMPKQRLRQLQLLRSQLLRQSEDCLYLNIFAPLQNHNNKKGKFVSFTSTPKRYHIHYERSIKYTVNTQYEKSFTI